MEEGYARSIFPPWRVAIHSRVALEELVVPPEPITETLGHQRAFRIIIL